MSDDRRGQVFSLEAIAAGILLLSSLTFALQVTAVTPLSASTSSQHIENQASASADGVLAGAVETGAVRRMVLLWNESEQTFDGADDPPSFTNESAVESFTLGHNLVEAFDDRGIAFNLYVRYETADGDLTRREVVYRGAPSDNAVSASRSVTILDDDPLYEESDGDGVAEATGRVVSNSTSFYAPDASPTTPVYNVVRVEVVAWRM